MVMKEQFIFSVNDIMSLARTREMKTVMLSYRHKSYTDQGLHKSYTGHKYWDSDALGSGT